MTTVENRAGATVIRLAGTVMLRCAECKLPIAEIRRDELVIVQKHHGERHETTIPARSLRVVLE